MTPSAAQAAAFYDEVLGTGEVWTLKDDASFPAPENHSGARAMPFWSLRSRAEHVIEGGPPTPTSTRT